MKYFVIVVACFLVMACNSNGITVDRSNKAITRYSTTEDVNGTDRNIMIGIAKESGYHNVFSITSDSGHLLTFATPEVTCWQIYNMLELLKVIKDYKLLTPNQSYTLYDISKRALDYDDFSDIQIRYVCNKSGGTYLTIELLNPISGDLEDDIAFFELDTYGVQLAILNLAEKSNLNWDITALQDYDEIVSDMELPSTPEEYFKNNKNTSMIRESTTESDDFNISAYWDGGNINSGIFHIVDQMINSDWIITPNNMMDFTDNLILCGVCNVMNEDIELKCKVEIYNWNVHRTITTGDDIVVHPNNGDWILYLKSNPNFNLKLTTKEVQLLGNFI